MEWTVVTVIIALVGFVAAVIKPIVNLNSTIVKLTTVVDNLKEDMDGFGTKNTESHRRIWEKNNQQDETLDDHEKRITTIEAKK